MAYFNHAFSKVFVGTEGFTGLAGGQLGTTGNILATGEFAFVDPTTWNVQAVNAPPANCCPLILAAGSLYSSDKNGPFHGGYQESNKSKMINPKYVNRFYKVSANDAQANIIHVGSTPYTDGLGSPANDGCCCEFLCDETYNLRLDIKGSPALRFLNHQAYKTLDAYTGCCPDGAVAPTLVDSTEVFIKWATQIVEDPIMSQFVYPVVYSEAGDALYPPGTDPAFIAAQPAGTTTWDLYVSPGHVADACAGMVLTAAYIDTKFGDCTFQPSDFYELEPLRLYASEVDLNGDPCTFAGCCVITECPGLQAMGLGESVVRDVILSEEYRQNFFHSDLRIREITQGDQILNVLDRTASYDRYCILHSVPRFNNPTGTFDNDQYMLDIIVPAGSDQSVFEAFVTGWLADCSQCTTLEEVDAITACDPSTPIPPVV
jgi:hypothetical protein